MVVERHVVAVGLGHLLFAVGADKQRHGQHGLGLLAVELLHVAAHEEVEDLVLAAHLDIRLYGHGVVALQQGVQYFQQAYRGLGLHAGAEILPLQEAGNSYAFGGIYEIRNTGGRAGEERLEPFAVEPYFRSFRVEDLEGLLGVGFGVIGHGLMVQHRPGGIAARGVSDLRGKIAYDKHHGVAEVLELAQLGEDDAVAEVQVAAGGIRAEFHPQLFARRKLFYQLFAADYVDRTARYFLQDLICVHKCNCIIFRRAHANKTPADPPL